MKYCLALLCAGGTFLAASPATALTITPASSCLELTGNDTSQDDIDAAIAGTLGTSVELYKKEVDGGGEFGSLAGSYETTFSNEPDDPEDALIEYVGGPIVGPTAYLLIKDGSQSPAWYLFDLTCLGWNGTDDIELDGFWPQQGAISHVALYGTTASTPDGGATVGLLGLALASVGLIRRFSKKA
jgi:hypothetical protein